MYVFAEFPHFVTTMMSWFVLFTNIQLRDTNKRKHTVVRYEENYLAWRFLTLGKTRHKENSHLLFFTEPGLQSCIWLFKSWPFNVSAGLRIDLLGPDSQFLLVLYFHHQITKTVSEGGTTTFTYRLLLPQTYYTFLICLWNQSINKAQHLLEPNETSYRNFLSSLFSIIVNFQREV